MSTTKYASWANVFGSLSPREDVNAYAGRLGADYDLDDIEADYRAAIHNLLPGSMFLSGDEFIADVDDDEIPEDWEADLYEQDLFRDADEMGQMFEDHQVKS